MSQNPHIPQLFRDIFKDSYLPYRDFQTLSLFLKEINEFTYDHSEKLGDAFEYLLSVLGSQGDAGQFRTPRHIIDFIVDVVGPKKDETILDPACGTAGFLISAYKHILAQHDCKDDPEHKEVPLTPDEKKRLMNNIVGYDISPDMVRLSLVNMYLHGFPTPNISEYDTLTDEEKWDDSYDVILANPPFMTPTGGIRPHRRFSIQANRSEVLFVDYIAEHLNPKGRGAVIVPEGIIFQTGNAYKSLRKMLVENYLYSVVSLPAGVFNPYSGVKTSILFFDKELAKKVNDILFVKVRHDGFELGAQRRSHDKNDLPEAVQLLSAWQNGEFVESEIASYVPKESINGTSDHNLSIDIYANSSEVISTNWSIIKLGDVCKIVTGRRDANHGSPEGKYPFFTCAKEPSRINEFSFDTEAILIAGNGDVGAVKYYNGKFDAYQRTYVLTDFDNVDSLFLFYILNARLKGKLSSQKLGNTMPYIKLGMLQDFQFPLPPLEVQKQIVEELNSYQKVIDGAKQIIQNWKPVIRPKPEWGRKSLVDICDKLFAAGDVPKDNFSKEKTDKYQIPIFTNGTGSKSLYGYTNSAKVAETAVTISARGTIGFTDIKVDPFYPAIRLIVAIPKKAVLNPYFLKYAIDNLGLQGNGNTIPQLTVPMIKNKIIPLPSLEIQEKIITKIQDEEKIVKLSAELIKINEQKIQDKIAEIWGEK